MGKEPVLMPSGRTKEYLLKGGKEFCMGEEERGKTDKNARRRCGPPRKLLSREVTRY